MGVGAREFVVYLLQRPGNVLERIDLVLKQFLGFYGIIERIVELVGEEFVILQPVCGTAFSETAEATDIACRSA